MFFVVSKIVGFFTWPSNLLIVIAFAGALLLVTRFARAGLQCLLAILLLLGICGLSPLGNVLMVPLENRFPPWNPRARRARRHRRARRRLRDERCAGPRRDLAQRGSRAHD